MAIEKVELFDFTISIDEADPPTTAWGRLFDWLRHPASVMVTVQLDERADVADTWVEEYLERLRHRFGAACTKSFRTRRSVAVLIEPEAFAKGGRSFVLDAAKDSVHLWRASSRKRASCH